MPLKQQTLSASFDRHPTRRRIRTGSHNVNWDAIEFDDLVECLVDAAMHNGDKYWTALLKLRGLSKSFHRHTNAKLDQLVATLRTKAQAARAEHAALTAATIPKPEYFVAITYWIKRVHDTRVADPVVFSAYADYSRTVALYFSPDVVVRLLRYNHTTGFWLHRDELFAWHFQRCIKCRGHFGLCTLGINAAVTWMAPCHAAHGSSCCPIAFVPRPQKARNMTERRADIILSNRPRTHALSEMLRTNMHGTLFWVEPITGIPPEYTLLGASGMDKADVDSIAAAEEAQEAAAKAAAATERAAARTAKRDAEVAKLEAAAEAYLSTNVESIPTLSRLQDLERFYGIEHAIPPRPLPPHRKLPLHRVRFDDRMAKFFENVELLA